MSWAGKKSVIDSFRSLFKKKEQAPSFSVHTISRLECQIQTWEDSKAYRIPDRSLSESAKRIGTDAVTLYRYFRYHRGIDFRTYRTRLRIEDAKAMLLAEPDTPASLIGRRVGYRDRSNFTTHFKELTGHTPDVWRRKNSLS